MMKLILLVVAIFMRAGLVASSTSSTSTSSSTGSTTGQPLAPGTLYGIYATGNLVEIQTDTGKTIPVGQGLTHEFTAMSLSSLGDGGIIYIIAYNTSSSTLSLLGLETKDGSIKYNVALPFIKIFAIGVGNFVNYNHITKRVYCAGFMQTGLIQVLDVNPRTKEIKEVTTISDITIVGAPSAFAWKDYLLVYPFARNVSGTLINELLTLDPIIKHVRYHPNKAYMETLAYDSSSGRVYGLGIITSSNTRTLTSFHPLTGEFRLIGKVSDYVITLGAISTIDVVNRRLFAMMSPDNAPFDLVAFSLHDASVVSHPVLADCPWNLEYIQGGKH